MAATKKSRIRADLEDRMKQKKLTSALYTAQLDQYMALYDQLNDLNRLIKSTDSQKIKFECMKESRQIQKSMQGILSWMKIDPAAESAEKEEDYEL